MYFNHSKGHNDSLEQNHFINSSNDDDSANLTLSRCLQTNEEINLAVHQAGQTKALAHQLKDTIRTQVDTFYGKDESQISHHRRRPPVEAWNFTNS